MVNLTRPPYQMARTGYEHGKEGYEPQWLLDRSGSKNRARNLVRWAALQFFIDRFIYFRGTNLELFGTKTFNQLAFLR